MVAYANLAITSPLTVAGLQSQMDLSMGGLDAVTNFTNYIIGAEGGNQSAALTFNVGRLLASGTFTFVSVIATDVLVINGVSFTCVASGATGNQFNVGASDTLTAAAAAAAINASVTALVSGVVVATSNLGVVTITAAKPGASGNLITIDSPDATITASGARLTGGSDGTVTTVDLS